jgi:DNA-binding NarL/FixJ family response regulator
LEQASVLLVDMPRIVREMIEGAVRSEADLVLVGSVADAAALQEATRRARPRLVVLGAHGSELPSACIELLRELPQLVVVSVDTELGRAYVHATDRPVAAVDEVDPATLARLIRDLLASGD